MHDVAPELLEAVLSEANRRAEADAVLREVAKAVREARADYRDVHRFAVAFGGIFAAAFSKVLSEDVLPDGRMWYNIAKRLVDGTFPRMHREVSQVVAELQEHLNARAGLGLHAVAPEYPEDRARGIVEKLSGAARFSEVAYMLDEPVRNFAESVVDDAVRANAEFHYRSGLSPRIVRRSSGKCCAWCDALVGIYRYPDVPQDVYRRHQFCRCTVEYDPGYGATRSVWSPKGVYSSQGGARKKRIAANVQSPVDAIRQKIAKTDLSTASVDEIIALGKEVNQHGKIRTIIGDQAALVRAFSQYREMGGTIDASKWAARSSKAVRAQLEHAFSLYPKAWSDRVNGSHRQLLAVKGQRGYFTKGAARAGGRYYNINYPNYRDGYWTICTDGARKTTPFHEIGHLLESEYPDIVRLEKAFVVRRTAGEAPTRLSDIFPGAGYRANEWTLKDNFISPYIGKVYPDATEVLSMGLESLFEPGIGHAKFWNVQTGRPEFRKITDDEEYLNFILGLLVTI